MQSLLIVALLSLGPATREPARDTVVICPESFLDELQPWLAHRARQGHRCAYVSSDRSPAEIRSLIREVASEKGLRFIVIIGNATLREEDEDGGSSIVVPPHLSPAQVNVRFGSDREIATDNWFADLNDDRVPDVAIGRLPAASRHELSVMIQKILTYEHAVDTGLWQRRINLVAGVGGFGRIADAVIETTAKKFITHGIPPEYKTTMTYGNWGSPYCPDPRFFGRAAIQRLNEGCLFWVYMGHGKATRLDGLRLPGGRLPILNRNDVASLQWITTPAIAVFLSCYTAAFDHHQPCLAEEMIRHDGGPVAVFGGSRVTMPYGMSVLANELMHEYFQHRPATLGELLLGAKRGMLDRRGDGYTGQTSGPSWEENPGTMAPVVSTTGRPVIFPASSVPTDMPTRRVISGRDATENNSGARVRRIMLDTLAKAFGSTSTDLAAERLEHVLMFNLLGDPLLRLRYPNDVDIVVDRRIEPGKQLKVSGTTDVDGKCLVELVCRRDRLTFKPAWRGQLDRSRTGLNNMTENYKKANDRRWTSQTTIASGGRFRASLDVPASARGPCYVRVFVKGTSAAAVGAADVYVISKSRSTKKPSLQ